MKDYVLSYLKEEMFIQPVDNAVVELEEEYENATIPIGYRLVINKKETDIVVWYVDINKWLAKKYEKLKNSISERGNMRN